MLFEGEELHGASNLGEMDLEAEVKRLEAKVAECEKAVGGFKGRLSNASYVERAPAHVVEETRQRLAAAEADLETAAAALQRLQESRS